MRRTLVALALALLLVSPVGASEGWFATGSYMHLGDSASTLFTEEDCGPALDVTTSSYGFAAGLGYAFKSGWTVSGQLLHARQDVDASFRRHSYDGSQSKNGFIVTTTVPLRWFSPCTWNCK